MGLPPSALGRLLYEIAWDTGASDYQEGGRGYENVLSAEVFQALDFLPRDAFLGRVLRSAQGGATAAAERLAEQIEQASMAVLPGDIVLARNPSTGKASYTVQPDGIIESSAVYCLVEAKRIRRSYFQPEQLARELLAAIQEAGPRLPLLLLVMSEPPPVPVRSHGRLSVQDAIAGWLEPVLERADFEFPPSEVLIQRIDSIVAFITWDSLSECVVSALAEFDEAGSSASGSASRLVDAICRAIEWHS